MSKAQWARLVLGIAGVLATGVAVHFAGSTSWTVAAIVGGFILTSVLSHQAFRALASPEEIRRDLEDRVRAED